MAYSKICQHDLPDGLRQAAGTTLALVAVHIPCRVSDHGMGCLSTHIR